MSNHWNQKTEIFFFVETLYASTKLFSENKDPQYLAALRSILLTHYDAQKMINFDKRQNRKGRTKFCSPQQIE